MGAAPGDGRDDRGFALLIVLWSGVLIAFLAGGIAAAGRTDTQLAANIRDAAVAEAAADGAVQAAAFHLLNPADSWPADGQPRSLSVPGATVLLRVEDEGGKVNPNIAAPELLRALLRQFDLSAEAAEALAAGIVEWRSAPDKEAGGRIARRYHAAGLDYEPPGAPFEGLDELRLVLGMPPGLPARLVPFLSLLTDTDPDPALAGPVVRRSLLAARPAAPNNATPTAATPGAPRAPRAVTVVAEAVTPSGARFTRRAGLRLGRGQKERLVTVATWDAVPAGVNP